MTPLSEGSARVALLARLEQPEERAAEVGFGGELLQYPEEYRRVHVVAAGVPMVFAINKIDKPNANPDHINSTRY